MTCPTRSPLERNGGDDRHLLHVVDEQRDRLALVAPRDVGDGRDVRVGARSGDEDHTVGVRRDAALGLVEERIRIERLTQRDRARGNVADARLQLEVPEPGPPGDSAIISPSSHDSSRVSRVTSSCS